MQFKKYFKRHIIAIFLISAFPLAAHPFETGGISFGSRMSIWGECRDEWQLGLREIPELRLEHLSGQGAIMDMEVSLHMSTWWPADSISGFIDNKDVGFYRAWMRYAPSQFEIRAGLQKINFGPARILRTLRWFDNIDVRDPMGITMGVWGILARYYFINNANVWLWALHGNNGRKGLELFDSKKDHPELGGRVQVPVPSGEIALTLHGRHIGTTEWDSLSYGSLQDGREFRCGVDGIWDLGPGLWFETALSEIRIDKDESLWQEYLTAGADYTVGAGPGIHVLCEHFLKTEGREIYRLRNAGRITAVSMDFSLSMFDSITAIAYYDWDRSDTSTYAGWERAYDNWLFNLYLFSAEEADEGSYSGSGGRFMVTYVY
ncbi:MAG: hypothetical protein ABIH89_05435 [Elusimicrobiota bacterium]